MKGINFIFYFAILPLVFMKPVNVFKRVNLNQPRRTCGGSKPSYCCDHQQLYTPLSKPTNSLIKKVGEWKKSAQNNNKCNNLGSSAIPIPTKIGIPYSYNKIDQALNYDISLFKVIGKLVIIFY